MNSAQMVQQNRIKGILTRSAYLMKRLSRERGLNQVVTRRVNYQALK